MPPSAWKQRLSQLWGSFALRLSLWYAGVFTFSALVLFGLLYLLLVRFFENSEREIISARLKECVAIYARGGLPALNDLVRRDEATNAGRSFFIRVTGPLGSVLLLAPGEWRLQSSDDGTSLVRADPRAGRGGSTGLPPGTVWRSIPRDERSEFVIASALLSDGSVLQVGRSTDRAAALLHPFRVAFAVALGPTLLLGLVGGAVFAHRAITPVRDTLRTARRIISTGNFDERVPETQAPNELADLARQFNRVLEKNGSLLRATRETLDNVAHDLRTPLTRLRAAAETALADDAPPTAAREALAECSEESERVLTMLNVLLDVTAAEQGMMTLRREEISLSTLLREVIELYELVAEERRITVHPWLAEPCPANVDPTRLRQAFANLLDNALKYTPEGGQVWVTCHRDEATGTARVTIRDDGPGIPPEEQGRIWDRLYRGDKSRTHRGLGLGLSLVKAVVEAHGGSVEVSSRFGEGAEFTVILPVGLPARGSNR